MAVTCGALDVVSMTTYCCTLDAGHTPAGQHRSDYREPDPDNPPFARAASHAWTAPPP